MLKIILLLMTITLISSCSQKYFVYARSCYSSLLPPSGIVNYDTLEECQRGLQYDKDREKDFSKAVISKRASIIEDKEPDQYSCVSLAMVNAGVSMEHGSPTFDSVEKCEKSKELKKYNKLANDEFIKRRIPIVEKMIKANKRLAPFKKKIINREVYIGMPEYALIASWGEPERINTTTTQQSKEDQYVYTDAYVYLINGIVKAVQSSR